MWKKAQVSKQPFGASGKESPANCRRIERCEFDPWVRKIPGEGNVNPLQCSCLENSLHRGAWQPAVHGVNKESDMTERLTLQNNPQLTSTAATYKLDSGLLP